MYSLDIFLIIGRFITISSSNVSFPFILNEEELQVNRNMRFKPTWHRLIPVLYCPIRASFLVYPAP